MSRAGRTEPSLRILLTQARLFRAVDNGEGKLDCPAISAGEDVHTTGAGTPAVALLARYFRASWMIQASYIHGKQTPAKQRAVPMSPSQAFALLTSTVTAVEHTAAMNLAIKLLTIVEEKTLLRGYSSVCVAGACIIAAEQAMGKTLVYEDDLEELGVSIKAVGYAYMKLKAEMNKNLKAVGLVIRAKGDPEAFPGRPLISSKVKVTQETGSQLTIMLGEMTACGGSSLRTVVSVDELPDPAPPKSNRYYACQEEDDMMFEFEDESPCDEKDDIVLPRLRFDTTAGDDSAEGDDIDDGNAGQDEHGRERRGAVTGLGMALGGHLAF